LVPIVELMQRIRYPSEALENQSANYRRDRVDGKHTGGRFTNPGWCWLDTLSGLGNQEGRMNGITWNDHDRFGILFSSSRNRGAPGREMEKPGQPIKKDERYFRLLPLAGDTSA
jgi:hypothetical protein